MRVTEQFIHSEWWCEGRNFETMRFLRKVREGRRETEDANEISERRGGRSERCERREGRSERRGGRSERRGGWGERRGGGGGSMGAEEEGREVRMSASQFPRGPHFLLRLAMVVAVVVVLVAPQPATAVLPPQLPYSLPPPQHSLPHRLPLLLRAPYKGGGVRSRGTRAALAPPTVTSLRPPDKSVSGHRNQGTISGSVGGSSDNISPPVVASQSPAVTAHANNHRNHQNNHHNHYNNHQNSHNYQGSVAPVATAASRPRSWGGNQQQGTNSHSGTVAWAEGEDGIHIYGQGSWSPDGRTRGNRESGWNLKSDPSGNENGDSSVWHGGELNENRQVISWDEDNEDAGGGGWVRGEGNVWREVERDPRAQEDVWREGAYGGRTAEGVAGGRGKGTKVSSRNDTFGHAITEDLSHLSPRNSHGGSDSHAPPPAGGRHHHDTHTRHLWVLEEVREGEEEQGGEDVEGEGMAVMDTLPPAPVSSDFLNAYLHAVQHYNDSRREDGGRSYSSSSSSPSSSHPSFTGSSHYSSRSSSVYSSSSKLQDDLSPFHQSIVPQPRPIDNHDDEYEPEDYINYHEYDHRGRNAFPQEETRQTNETPDQHGNVATHHSQHRTLSIQEIVRLKGLKTMDELLLLLKRKGTNYHELLELVNRGATKSDVLAFLNRPDVGAETTNQEERDDDFSDGDARGMVNHYPDDETESENEMDDEGELNDDVAGERQEQRKGRRNRKKDRGDRGKRRRDRMRGRKNGRGRNKGRRRGRVGENQTTIPPPPLSPPTPAPTNINPPLPAPTFSNFSTKHPLQPRQSTTDTTATLLPATSPAEPTTLAILPHSTLKSSVSVPEDPTGKTAKVSEITVTVMKAPDETEHDSEVTIVEDLRPARRRPNLQGQPPKDQYNRRHRGETRPREGTQDRGVGMRRPGITVAEGPNEDANLSREQQEQYQFPVKGIMIISGLMGALAVFTLVVLISYAVIKCSKKPAVNNYQVSEQKNAVPS